MPTSAKVMIVCTVLGLVVVSAYTVALGSDGWLWFTWVVLAFSTAGALVARPPR
jgi:hypothetical protein